MSQKKIYNRHNVSRGMFFLALTLGDTFQCNVTNLQEKCSSMLRFCLKGEEQGLDNNQTRQMSQALTRSGSTMREAR